MKIVKQKSIIFFQKSQHKIINLCAFYENRKTNNKQTNKQSNQNSFKIKIYLKSICLKEKGASLPDNYSVITFTRIHNQLITVFKQIDTVAHVSFQEWTT